MKVIFVIEDATTNVHRQRDQQASGGVSSLSEMMVMSRALEEALFYASHDYSSISDMAKQNTEVLIFLGLPGESNYNLRNYLDFTEDQIAVVKNLKLGQAIMINRALWSKPVLITIEKPMIPESCNPGLVRQSVEGFLRQLKTSPPYPITSAALPSPKKSASVPASPILNAREVEFLVLASQKKLTLSGIYLRLGLTNSQGRRIVKKLISLGLIILHSLPTGRRGSKVQLPDVTEQGWVILQHEKHCKPKDEGQGPGLHKTAAQLIKFEGTECHEQTFFEVKIAKGRMDVLRINPQTQMRTFYNIGLSTPEYEAQSIIHFYASPESSNAKFVLVVQDQKFAQKVEACLKKSAEGKQVINRYTTRLIGSFVKI